MVFASGLQQPFGIAFYPLGPNPHWVYIANSDGVVRFSYKNGDLEATGRPERIIEGIPSAHHYARDIVFSPDGSRLGAARVGEDKRRDDDEVSSHQPQVKISPPLVSMA